MVALRGLVTDFVMNGGINRVTGEMGGGMMTSFIGYYRGHFRPFSLQPIAYRRFGELIEALVAEVKQFYPKAGRAFAECFTQSLLSSSDGGFGSPITLPAKTAMLTKINTLLASLTAEKAEKAA